MKNTKDYPVNSQSREQLRKAAEFRGIIAAFDALTDAQWRTAEAVGTSSLASIESAALYGIPRSELNFFLAAWLTRARVLRVSMRDAIEDADWMTFTQFLEENNEKK